MPAGRLRSWYGLAHAACCWLALSPWRHSLGHSRWAVITSAWPSDFKVHSAHYTCLLDVTRKPCLHIQGLDWHALWKNTLSTIHTRCISMELWLITPDCTCSPLAPFMRINGVNYSEIIWKDKEQTLCVWREVALLLKGQWLRKMCLICKSIK